MIAASDLTIHIKKSDKSTERFLVLQRGVGGHLEGTDTVWMWEPGPWTRALKDNEIQPYRFA